ncbi:MAG: RNA polymerase sigma factor [archaeon]
MCNNNDIWQKYMKTKNDYYLQKIFEANKYKIKSKIYQNYLQYYYEDLVQEIHLEIWKSLEKYDSNKCSFNGYINMIIDRKIIDYIKRIKRDKRYINHISSSINKMIGEDKNIEIINLLESNDNTEFNVVENIEFNRIFKDFLNELTNMERKSLLANLKYYTGHKQRDLDSMIEVTGLGKRQIENAFRRIREKYIKFLKQEKSSEENSKYSMIG